MSHPAKSPRPKVETSTRALDAPVRQKKKRTSITSTFWTTKMAKRKKTTRRATRCGVMAGLPQYAVKTGYLRSNQQRRIPGFPFSENGNLWLLQ
jgi:hypothetical protein